MSDKDSKPECPEVEGVGDGTAEEEIVSEGLTVCMQDFLLLIH